MTAKLSAHAATLVRGDRCLFRDLEFALADGELLLLEGQNGSGKTSLMKAIVGMLDLEEGEIRWQGRSIREVRQAFHDALVWMAHRVGFKADLTLVENLRFEAALRPTRDIDFERLLDRLALTRLRNLPLRSLSAGQQRRVALARMLRSAAPLWMMDEPFTNLDREGRALVLELVSEHLAGGGMCVMAAHQDVELDAPIRRVTL